MLSRPQILKIARRIFYGKCELQSCLEWHHNLPQCISLWGSICGNRTTKINTTARLDNSGCYNTDGKHHWKEGRKDNQCKMKCSLCGTTKWREVSSSSHHYWYSKAAKSSDSERPANIQGDSAAASNIAILYRERECRRLERQWFEQAAVLGDGDAEVKLTKLYFEGKRARRYNEKAVALPNSADSSSSITEAGREEVAALLIEVGSTR
jgi:hypothetical protein